MLTLTGALIHVTRGSAWLLPALALHGVVLDFLFCAEHETVHRTAFASRALNDAIAWVCGLLLLLPPEYFRLFHFAHHRHTQDYARDPELGLAPPRRLRTYLWRATGLPNWWDRTTITLRHALTGTVPEPFVPPAERAAVVREARLFWTLYAAVFVGSGLLRRPEPFFYWVIPALLGQPFLRLYLMAEHTGCGFHDNVYANTRTIHTNALVRLIAWQMPYHIEHHAYPSVPFHALRALHRLIRARIEVSAPGYFAFHRTLIRDLRTQAALARPDAAAIPTAERPR